MAEEKKQPPISLGIFGKSSVGELQPSDIIAIALSAFWLLAVVVFFVVAGGVEQGFDALTFVMVVMAIFLPVAVIWIGALAARNARVMREESARLQSALEAMRRAYLTQVQTTSMGIKPSVERKLDEIVAVQRQTETAIATFATGTAPKPALSRPVATAKSDGQAALALGTPAEAMQDPISNKDFIRALNFPDNENDADGFAALRRALKDRQTAKLVRAAQDVLTLLSQDGIYTDDLLPDRAQADVWRRFASGERGTGISAIGGIRDRSSLALSAGRMKQDQIFRDAAHHFLREFDKTIAIFEGRASDAEITELANTRSARAFMLLGRVAGTFD